MGLAFIGRVPLNLEIRIASDAGAPPATGDGPAAQPFLAIAERVARWLDNRTSQNPLGSPVG
jgi:ATP-binding protein involved in chromosome partitioning